MIFASTARQESEANLKRIGLTITHDLVTALSGQIFRAVEAGAFEASISLPGFVGKEMRHFVLKKLHRHFKGDGYSPFMAGWDGNTYTSFGVKW